MTIWLKNPLLRSRAVYSTRAPGNALPSYHTAVKPLKLPNGHHSILPLILECNNLILPHRRWQSEIDHIIATRTANGEFVNEETVLPLLVSHHHHENPVGFVRQQVASALEGDHQKHLISGSASPWDLRYSKDFPRRLKSIAFAAWVNEGGKYTRTMHMGRIVSEWRKQNLFQEILRGWSDEAYPVYTHPLQDSEANVAHDPIAFAIERAALPLFGLVNFGALLIAYTHNSTTGQTMLWIPRRSLMKRTWPGKFDVTVGGGMGLGESAMATIIRESAEEALLDQDYVQQFIRPVGVLPFSNRSPGGWLLPGMYYLFDLPLPHDGSLTPRINALDGEVEKFELLNVEDTLKHLLDRKFKSSSALAVVDFFLRHGHITEETDPRYLDICRHLKTDIKLPMAWRLH